jgi:hypothetical protein
METRTAFSELATAGFLTALLGNADYASTILNKAYANGECVWSPFLTVRYQGVLNGLVTYDVIQNDGDMAPISKQ